MNKPPEIAGLLKFFSKPEYLEAFLQGNLFCNTPHYYRNCAEAGVSDRFEAVIGYFNRSLGQREPKLIMDGKPLDISEATEVYTFLDEDYYDAWLSCWFILEVPESNTHLRALKRDVDRVVKEFGNNYVLLPLKSFVSFRSLLAEAGHKLTNGPVKYTEKDLTRGMFKKRPEFDYQREYRFAFGECDKSELSPLRLHVDADELGNMVVRNPKIKFTVNGDIHDILV